jgi:hypothetical protein
MGEGGGPMIRLKGMTINDDLKAGEEVSTLYSIIFLIMGLLVGF